MGQNITSNGNDINFKGYTSSSWTSSIGIYYFYNVNHQFELKYRYRSGYGYDDGGKVMLIMAQLEELQHFNTPLHLKAQLSLLTIISFRI